MFNISNIKHLLIVLYKGVQLNIEKQGTDRRKKQLINIYRSMAAVSSISAMKVDTPLI